MASEPRVREWIAIVGSRDYPDRQLAEEYVGELGLTAWDSGIVSGGARGVDTWVEATARECGLQVRVIRPDYEKWSHRPKYAPLARNLEIIDAADLVMAFWDGESRGTLHTITEAVKRGRRVEIVPPRRPESRPR